MCGCKMYTWNLEIADVLEDAIIKNQYSRGKLKTFILVRDQNVV